MEMAEADQAERTHFGEIDAAPWHDEARTARLIEIVDEYGWPSPDLVGDDASSAALLITQHSDANPEFQQRVLTLLTNGQNNMATREGVALLTDRVAANTNRPQKYGSQTGCMDGQPVPRPDLAEPEQVDQLRSQVGLEPLETYLARFEQHCADLERLPIEAGCQPVMGVGRAVRNEGDQ